MSNTGTYRQTELFTCYLTEVDEDMEFADLDALSMDLIPELNAIEPFRDVKFELDFLGIAGEAEFLFSFKRMWDDRESDLLDYLDKVQEAIENGLPVIVVDRRTISIVPV